MKLKSFIPLTLSLAIGLVSITGCQKGDLIDNPNVAAGNATVPSTLILNHLTATLIGNTAQPFEAYEQPFEISTTAGQYVLSNYQYYRGNNNYNYGTTIDSYGILKYAIALQAQSTQQLGNQTNKYFAIGQFFKAYAGIWLAQRVGDIPFSQAGNPAILTPKYDTQESVYQQCLALLNSANTLMTPLLNSGSKFDAGDIFGLTYLQWQKVINTYTLRVLISLSKRAEDTPSLNIPQTFANIVNNPGTYPVMTSISDNVIYTFSAAFNEYPIFQQGDQPYNNFANMGEAYINVTAPEQDPRLYVVATPAPALVAGGKAVSDFTAYVGSDDNSTLPTLLNNSNNGAYSYTSYNRYYTSNAGALAEPFTFIGYSELCFNIAEGINRGWATGQSSTTWYDNGINASLAVYGITDGETVAIGYPLLSTNTAINPKLLGQGATWGTATVNLPQFMANVAYVGDNANGLAQIFTQRYIAMFANSGWEPFYEWRRSVSTTYPNGLPAWDQGGAGIGTINNLLPRRWEYPTNEAVDNATNYKAALESQFGGTDDPTKDTWLTK
jgi:hypothetical protein